jgi:hypothetical protein
MDTLEKETNELKGFIADLKADRAAQKEKEKKESWTKYVSMSLVFIAVLAAVCTQWAGKYSSRTLVELNNSTFDQAQASGEWGYYQANSIKQNLYEALQEIAPKETVTADSKSMELFKTKIAKYEALKKEQKDKAEALQKARDEARAKALDSSRHGSGMGMATSIFQISIALGSICLVTKKKWLWYLSLLLAAGATWQMMSVWLN